MKLEPTLRVLMGVFLAQGFLAILTWWPSGEGPVEARDLVEVDASELEGITVTGTVQRGETPDDPLVLRKDGDTWILPDKFDMAAREERVDKLLELVDKLEVRRPIAENAYRHADLDVAEDQHARKLVLETGEGEPVTVYVGSASGSAVHVRLQGEDEVYRVRGVTSYGISTGATSYLDAEVLKVDPSTVDDVAVARADGTSFTFTKTDLGWDLDAPSKPGRALDPTKAADFVRGLLSLRMREPLGTTVTPDMGFEGGTEVTWTATEDGTTVTGRYVVGSEIDDSGRYRVQIDGDPMVYDVLGAQVAQAVEKPLGALFTAR